jgi:integrase
VLLGKYDSPESWASYDRVLAEWRAGGRRLMPRSAEGSAPTLSVNEVILAYWKHAEAYYRHPDGRSTTELNAIKYALRPLRRLYGTTGAAEFDALRLEAIREEMIRDGFCRGRINKDIDRIKRVFKWAVAKKLVPPGVHQQLAALEGLRAGRTAAKESEPVHPVEVAHVEAVLPFLRPEVAGMVRVQLHSGARPGEVCIMRACDIDTNDRVWLYRPQHHKNAYRGHSRLIPLGPRCQAVLREFLRVTCPECGACDRPGRIAWRSGLCGPCADRMDERGVCGPWPNAPTPGDYHVFSPAEAVRGLREEQRRRRKSKVQPSQVNRRKRNPKRKPRDRYTPDSYNRAVRRAIEAANRARVCDTCKELRAERCCEACKSAEVPHWHVNQLRHTKATQLRNEADLDIARAVLGHRSPHITAEFYAELDAKRAAAVMERLG